MSKIKEFISDLWVYNIVDPLRMVKHRVKWFFQRRFRGFDDREIWNIDETFYKWLLPRLKVFQVKACAYPTRYKSMSSWQKELVNRIKQLELIIDYDYCEHEFPNLERYLSENQINKLKQTLDKGQINYVAFNSCVDNFNKWFSKNIRDLWY